MKRIFFLLTAIIILMSIVGCARGCGMIDREFQMTDKVTIVQQYSGGKLVNRWQFTGMVNSSSSSDGYYFTISDTLIEVSGDVVIKILQ